tara:strand:+ start:26183 stop:26704 length:522 start_codon:yes stop_codon:yes gene_type:complete
MMGFNEVRKHWDILGIKQYIEVTMNLEEVKEHFKNAKEVKCLVDKKIYNIDVRGGFENSPNQVDFGFIDHQHGTTCVVLYVTDELAEIISYKEFEERAMLVSDDEEIWYRRVVFMEKNNRFIAWNYAKTIEEAGGICKTTNWTYAKELPKEIEVTKEEIAKWKGCDVEQLIIK